MRLALPSEGGCQCGQIRDRKRQSGGGFRPPKTAT